MDKTTHFIFLVNIKDKILEFLKEKGFIKELEHNCDIYLQRYQALNNKESLIPLCISIKLNFSEFCDDKGVMK